MRGEGYPWSCYQLIHVQTINMSELKVHVLNNDISRLLIQEISMPNMTKLLVKEPVKVNSYVSSQDDLELIKKNPEEPLNIRFKMDQVEVKIPNYSLLENINIFDESARSILLSSTLESNNEICVKIPLEVKFDNEFSGKFEKNFIDGKEYIGNWSSIFTRNEIEKDKKFLLPKSNAIIINDSYLFSQVSNQINLGVLNLINCLKILLPKDSKEEFHLLIITSTNKWSPNSAKLKFEEVLKTLNNEFSYPIFFELVIWETKGPNNHKRILISNYYTAITDYGFHIFNSNNQAVGNNDILVRRIFHDVQQPGDSPYEQSLIRMDLLKKTYKSAKEYCSKAPMVAGRMYLSNSNNMNKTNRLLI